MSLRNIVKIDESKCNGCGLCVMACAEGAIQVIDGKARLLSGIYCDGLGACLGECPQGAITVERRNAADFDAAAVEQHLAKTKGSTTTAGRDHAALPTAPEAVVVPESPCAQPKACPGSAARSLRRPMVGAVVTPDQDKIVAVSQLGNWPVQIALLPLRAPYLSGADLLLSADCAPFAYAGFHREFIAGRTVLVGCPKLDDGEFYTDKLAQIFSANDIRSIRVAFMEVPCCFGLVQIAREAIRRSGKNIPLALSRIGLDGTLQSEE